MYNVSNDYLEKINSVSREVYWYGSVTLTDGTVYNFDTVNLKQGQTSISRQLCANQKIQIGCTCSSELKISFMLEYDSETNKYYMNGIEVDRYKFFDAEIILYFRLYLDNERITYEDINLGTFIVSSADRSQSVLTCTAYDYMQKFTKACVSDIQGTPYSVLLTACSACGVTLGSAPDDIYRMVNGRNTCAMYDPQHEIKTWRDVIGFIAAMIGGNAIIKSDNKLYIVPYNLTPIRTISSDNRINLTLEDYITNYYAITAVNLRTNTEERIKQVSEGLTYAMGSNPLIQYVIASERTEVLARLLALLTNMDYVPFSGTFFTDPSFELGDVIEFTDNHAGTSTKSVITAIEIKLNSHMTMSCSGDNPYLQKAEDASDSQYASSTSGSVGDGVQFYDYLGQDVLTVSDAEPVEFVSINYQSNGSYRQEFEAEVKLSVVTSESVNNNIYTEKDAVVTVTYYVNGNPLVYQPEYTYQDGVYLLHLFFIWESNIRINISTFRATMSVNGATLTISSVRARIMQSGEAYVAPSNELEYIEVNPKPYKQLYRIGESLDYTGLVVYAIYEDGHKEVITNQCTFTPANGTTITEPNWIVVKVDYVKDNVPYTTDFELEVIYLESIDIKDDPTKTEYFVGENIDLSGIKVMAEFSNDATSNVTADCTFSPANGTALTQPGTVTVTASYTYDTITKTAQTSLYVEAITIEEFSVTPPAKVKYNVGETLDYTGLVATATYNNGTVKDVTNECVFEPENGSEADPESTIVTVRYTEKGVPYTDTFDIEVLTFDGISVDDEHANLSYWLGDETDYTGVVVTGEFSDGTTIDVTNDCTFNPPNGTVTTLSMSAVDVTYIRDNVTYMDSFSIEVKEPEPVLKYLIYTVDTTNRKIWVNGLNASEIAEDNLRNLTIPSTYTDPESGITFDLIIWDDRY